MKVKHKLKLNYGMAVVIIATILMTVLYLVLDDKYFCLNKEKVDQSAKAPSNAVMAAA